MGERQNKSKKKRIGLIIIGAVITIVIVAILTIVTLRKFPIFYEEPGGCGMDYIYRPGSSGSEQTLNPEYQYLDKPIIYLYPEQETEVSVKLGYPEKLTTTYPKYNDGWKVLAKPNGDLIDLETGRNLYSLYWEGKNYVGGVHETGFVVKGEDTANFLEEKLVLLGLTEREANEFIIYWLPKMEHNQYNYIYFATAEEIENYMPLNIEPAPDATIRVMMEFKSLEQPLEISEQQLTPVQRSTIGFVAVEWGGSEIKD